MRTLPSSPCSSFSSCSGLSHRFQERSTEDATYLRPLRLVRRVTRRAVTTRARVPEPPDTSRLSCAMNSRGSLRHTLTLAVFEQLPNASRRMAATMFSVRSSRSGCPVADVECVTFAAVNTWPQRWGTRHAAPQPMHAAASNAVSAPVSRPGSRWRRGAAVGAECSAGLDDASKASDRRRVSDHRNARPPRFKRQASPSLKNRCELAHVV